MYVCVMYVCVCERGGKLFFSLIYSFYSPILFELCVRVHVLCICVCMKRKEKLFFSLIYSFYSPILFELCLCVCVCVCLVCACERDREICSFRSSTPFSP